MNNQLTRKFSTVGILSILLTTAIGQGIVRADIPGSHPHYLHARSDLRKAEQLLKLPEESNVKQEEKAALREIHAAIWEIDKAAVLDRKDMDDHPAIDTSLRHLSKFQEIERLLQSAKADISREEDNKAARPWRKQVNVHIDKADRNVDIAIKRDRYDDQK